jgi:hypothetical protein
MELTNNCCVSITPKLAKKPPETDEKHDKSTTKKDTELALNHDRLRLKLGFN